MGLFGKLKENFSHGGIKIQLQAPASASMQDATLPVTVNVTASDTQQNIKNITVRILAQTRNMAFSEPTNLDTVPTARAEQQVVAQTEYNQPFPIMPGETKSVQLSIVLNQGAAAQGQLPEGSAAAQVARMFQKLQSLSETMNGNNYEYFIETSAQVEGITLGPSYQQPIQILKPGQIGTAYQNNIRL